MSTPLALDTARRDNGRLVLTAVGEIDLSNVEAFAQALGAALTQTSGSGDTLTVDLSGVEYLDSAGINALFVHAEQIHLIAPPMLISVFAISGLTELTTVEAAPTPDC